MEKISLEKPNIYIVVRNFYKNGLNCVKKIKEKNKIIRMKSWISKSVINNNNNNS